jgi:hypothetical protein
MRDGGLGTGGFISCCDKRRGANFSLGARVAKTSLRENIWKGIGFAIGAAIVSAGLTAVVFAVQAAYQKRHIGQTQSGVIQ